MLAPFFVTAQSQADDMEGRSRGASGLQMSVNSQQLFDDYRNVPEAFERGMFKFRGVVTAMTVPTVATGIQAMPTHVSLNGMRVNLDSIGGMVDLTGVSPDMLRVGDRVELTGQLQNGRAMVEVKVIGRQTGPAVTGNGAATGSALNSGLIQSIASRLQDIRRQLAEIVDRVRTSNGNGASATSTADAGVNATSSATSTDIGTLIGPVGDKNSW